MSTTTEGLPSGCSYAHLSHPGSAARTLAGETAQPLTRGAADMVGRAGPREAGQSRTESNVMQMGEGAQARAAGGAAAREKAE